MNKTLKNTLLSITENIQTTEGYSYIDLGGCALFAHLIHKELYKRNIKSYLKFYRSSYSSNKESLIKQSLGYREYETCSHVAIQIGRHCYDSSGFKVEKGLRSIIETFKIECIPKQSYNMWNKGSWNNTFKSVFNKSKIKKLETIIKKEFRNYDKQIKTSNEGR